MTTTLKDSEDTSYYLSQFNELTQKFMGQLKSQNVAKLNTKQPDVIFSDEGRSKEQATQILSEKIIPYLSASAGPRYWGFVTGGANPAALFADWMVSTFDQNVSKDGDSISSAVERQTLDWLKDLFYLPEVFNGVITTGATAANFLGAVVARQFSGNQQGIDIAQVGMQGLSVELFSACPHASMIKGLGLAGFGQQQITRVDTLENSEQMDVEHLSVLLTNSKAKSKIVIASSATVTATSFDDLEAISVLCQQHQAWLHVDAAFGLFERVVTGKEGKTKGIELADSITLDFHKWLNVPYDAGAFFTRHTSLLVQCCEVDAPYLTNNDTQPDFLALGIENSRRFRALPVWFTLLKYGRKGIKEWVKRNIDMASELASWIELQPQFELSLACQLNVVVFRPESKHLSGEQAQAFTTSFLEEVNKEGKIFLSPGLWQGQKVIRAALSNWQTSKEDIELAKASLKSCYKMLVTE